MTLKTLSPDDKEQLDGLQARIDALSARVGNLSGLSLVNGTLITPGAIRVGGSPVTQIAPPPLDVVPPPAGVLTFTPIAYAGQATVAETIAWAAATGGGSDQVTGYQVEISADPVTTQRIVRTDGVTVTVDNLAPNTVYYVKVRSVAKLGFTSTTISGTFTSGRNTTAPAAATGLSVAAGYTTLTASWNDNAEADVKGGNGIYTLQVATDAAFATVVKTVTTAGTVASVGGLVTATTYYVRVAATNSSAVQGPWSAVVSVTPGLPTGAADGLAPSSSPAVDSVLGGPGFLLVRWTALATPGTRDTVVYEVHLSTASGFTPTTATKVAETLGTFAFVKTDGAGAALVYGAPYYARLVAKDVDGSAAAGTQNSGAMVKANTADIAAGAITAASAIIADATIGTAKIQDLAVATAKIADLAVGTAKIADTAIVNAKIANLAVDTAKIADLAVGTAKIANLAVTDAKILTLSATKITAGTISSQVITITGGTAGAVMTSGFSVGASSGWAIYGDGTAYFNSVTLYGSLVGNSTISIFYTPGNYYMLKVPHPTVLGAVAISANVEVGASYSGTVFSGDTNWCFQVSSGFNGGNSYATQLKWYPDGVGDRRVGFVSSVGNTFDFYIDTTRTIRSASGNPHFIQKTGQGGAWNNAAMIIRAGGSQGGGNGNVANSSIALWAEAFGIAPGIKAASWGGDNIQVVNSGDSYTAIGASQFVVSSSVRFKSNVKTMDEVMPKLRQMRAVTFNRPPSPCANCFNTGTVPVLPPALNTADFHPAMVADHPEVATWPRVPCPTCQGKDKHRSPAQRINEDTPFVGFTAEELHPLFPEAVHLDPDHKPLLVDYGSLVAVAFKGLQELDARLARLEAAGSSRGS